MKLLLKKRCSSTAIKSSTNNANQAILDAPDTNQVNVEK